jgi:hypothetical protein
MRLATTWCLVCQRVPVAYRDRGGFVDPLPRSPLAGKSGSGDRGARQIGRAPLVPDGHQGRCATVDAARDGPLARETPVVLIVSGVGGNAVDVLVSHTPACVVIQPV